MGIQTESDRNKRKELCSEVQKIVAEELPYVPLWYVDVVSVHRKGLKVELTPTGDYDFLIEDGTRDLTQRAQSEEHRGHEGLE